MRPVIFPHRMLGFRVRLLKEKMHLPPIIFGSHDASSLFGQNILLFFTKLLKIDFGDFNVSAGYAFDLLEINKVSIKVFLLVYHMKHFFL